MNRTTFRSKFETLLLFKLCDCRADHRLSCVEPTLHPSVRKWSNRYQPNFMSKEINSIAMYTGILVYFYQTASAGKFEKVANVRRP